MAMPRSRRRALSIGVGALFVANLLGLFFGLRAAFAPGVDLSLAQFAGGSLALLPPSTSAFNAPGPRTYECKPGHVQMITEAESGVQPRVEPTMCYARDPKTKVMTPVPNAKREACVFLPREKAEKCVVVYCPPESELGPGGKAGTCIAVTCKNQNDTDCFKQVASAAEKEGSRGIYRHIALNDPRAAAVIPGPNGTLDTSKFWTQVLNPEKVAAEMRADVRPGNSEYDQILKIADDIENKRPPCTNCTPTIQLNKDLVDASRLDACKTNPAACQGGPGIQTGSENERPTLRLPGGAGLPPPPLRPPPTPPQQRPPTPSPQSFPCTSVPQPSEACTGGSWQAQYGTGNCSGSVVGWTCGSSGSSGPPPPPTILLVANPSTVSSGGKAYIGWVTTGIDSCTILSDKFPDFTKENETNTSKNGVVQTPALTSSTDFVLKCKTSTGGSLSKTKTVEVSTASTDLKSAQFAAAVFGASQPPSAKTGTSQEYQCNRGQVQTLTQARKGSKPNVKPSQCYTRNPQSGKMQRSTGAKDRSCIVMTDDKANQCLVLYCPPSDALAKGAKAGTCFVVNCGRQDGKECLNQTVSDLGQDNGHLAVAARTLWNNPSAGGFHPAENGKITTGISVADIFDRQQIAEQMKNNPPDNIPYSKIEEIAEQTRTGSLPPPQLKLNEALLKEQGRIVQQPPPGPGGLGGGGGGGGGLGQPDSTGFQFPNIHKDPSGTDVLAWARYLMSGKKNTPPPQSQSSSGSQGGCNNAPQPPASQCEAGTWQSTKSGECISGWKCVRTRIISFTAVPPQVTSGATSTLGWLTEGMDKCIISSPTLPTFTDDNKSYTNVNGAVVSPPLTATTDFVLSCTTIAGTAHPPQTLTVGVLP